MWRQTTIYEHDDDNNTLEANAKQLTNLGRIPFYIAHLALAK